MTDASITLMENLYARLYGMLTMEPTKNDRFPNSENAGGRFNESNAAIHLSVPGISLYSEDYENMWTFGNPRGVQSKTALFSMLVDSMPSMNTARYEPSTKRVSTAWMAVVEAANATNDVGVDAKTQKMFDKIDNYLYEWRQEPASPFQDADAPAPEPKKTRHKTAVYERYLHMQEAMDDAREEIKHAMASASRAADWEADLSEEEIEKLSDERKQHLKDRALRNSEDVWEEKSYGPMRKLKRLKEEFDGDVNNKWVEQALAYTKTHGNELSMNLVKAAKELAEQGDWSGQVTKLPIKLSVPSATKWAEKDNQDGWTTLIANTHRKDIVKDHRHSETHAGGGGGFLWHVGGSYDETRDTKTLDTHFEHMKVSLEVTFVNIIRPWMDMTLFSDYVHWSAGTDQPAGSVSSGRLESQSDSNFLPLIPMQMIVARNVKLTAGWTDDHKQWLKTHLSTGGSAGWGPFSVSASHTEDHEHFEDHGSGAGSSLLCPGLQLLGFVSQVPPFAATDAGIGANGAKLTMPLADKADVASVIAQVRKPPSERDGPWRS